MTRSSEVAAGVGGLGVFLWLGGSHGYAALVGLGSVVVYAGLVRWFPLIRCGRCDGSGKIANPLGSGHRGCGKCQRKGEHVRFGRRMWDRRTQ